MTTLHFVSAPGGSAFMHELLCVVAHEVQRASDCTDVEAIVSEGPLPDDPDGVFVVVPHEYFVVLPEDQHPNEQQLRRTIGFCVEHPGTATFLTTVRMARALGDRVAISESTTSALNRIGLSTQRFVLGYSELWDCWQEASDERTLDVLYLGTADERRSRLISLEIEQLDEADLFLAMPPHEPMTRPRPDFFMGAEKHKLLARAKVLLNLHRSESNALEWVRVLEAMCNGCVVVTETSSSFDPLIPGTHFLMSRPRSLTRVVRALLADPDRLADLRRNAYNVVHTELDTQKSARMLIDMAQRLAATSLDRSSSLS